MTTTYDYVDRVVATDQLAALVHAAIDAGFKRQIDPVRVCMFDPEGLHLIHALLVHEHIAGKPSAPHLRCEVLVKVSGTPVPARMYLDVSVPDFEALALLTDVLMTAAELDVQQVHD